jgi:hypothetical protein
MGAVVSVEHVSDPFSKEKSAVLRSKGLDGPEEVSVRSPMSMQLESGCHVVFLAPGFRCY